MIDTHKGIIAWFARNSVAANLLMFCLLLGGVFSSYYVIQKEIFPAMDMNLISIQIPYPGAAPQEVEEGVNIKIEEAIEDIEGIKKITSTASEGFGSFNIEIQDDYNVPEVLDEIKMRVDGIPNFPDQIERPNIYQIKARADVIWVQVYGDLDELAMKKIANEVNDEVLALSTVTTTKVYGTRDYEISIAISEAELREYGLTFDQVVNAVKNASLDIPGGSLKTINGDILLRAKGQAYRGSEFENIVLLTRSDGTRLLLGDIAEVNDGFEERENFSLFDGKPGVSIGVVSVGEQNDLEIARQVKEYINDKQETLPSGVNIDYWGDSSHYLQGRLDLMLKNMFFGALLVFLILMLFLRLRLAFWVMVGIPVCFLGALVLMPLSAFDLSINMITLFAFILVLGIVVDDAIIIGESAYREIELNGHNMENVIIGAKKVAMPATFGVLTTIVAFMPMLAVTGNSAPIWQSIGMVVILCLVFSIIESKLILPTHIAHMKFTKLDPNSLNIFQHFQNNVNNKLNSFIHERYEPFLSKCIDKRYITLATFIGLLILAIGIVGSGMVRQVFFPNLPSDFIRANLAMVEGTPASVTNDNLARIQESLNEMDSILSEKYNEKVVRHSFTYSESTTRGTVFVELYKGENRQIDGFEIADRWREQIGNLPGVKSLVVSGSMGGHGGGDIAFQLTGKNLNHLASASKELQKKLSEYDGVFDIRDTFSGGKPEITLSLKPGAETLGISLSDVARQVRQGFYGAEVQRIARDGEEVKVMVRYPLEERRSVGNLEEMRIRTQDGREVPFLSVAELSYRTGYGSITRINNLRSVLIEASTNKSKVEPSKVTKEIKKEFLPELTKRYPTVSSKLEGASKDEGQALQDLALGGFFALFAIFALMAIPLKSYLQPLIIMSVIPFGIIGAIIGHLVLGLAISVLSLCGMIALSGVVVNDSLIMVDFVNRARAEGKDLRRATIEAGTIRFRAILLTSLTTFLGLLPMLLEKSLQAQIVIPMAVSLAFGILFATVITLLLIPSLYIILDDLKNQAARLFKYIIYIYRPYFRG